VVCGGIADGQTIQKADDHLFPPSAWDDLPSQNVCTGIDAEAVLDLISQTLASQPTA
jgi:inosine-uridine nucleoside N-ribohydrolase